MNKKTIYISIGVVLVAAGIAYYFFKKKKDDKGAGVTANAKESRTWNLGTA